LTVASEFLRTYDKVGQNIVTYANSVKGSPVVPNSAKKIIEEGERVQLVNARIRSRDGVMYILRLQATL
jgi:hypothetical protein